MKLLFFWVVVALCGPSALATPVDCSPSGVNSGSIEFSGSYDPNSTNTISSVVPASSTVGQVGVEYIWLKSLVNVPNTSGNPHWSVVEGSLNQEEIAVPQIVQTTYFMRCARLTGCINYWGETNIVGVPVDLCKAEFINAGSIAFEGSYNPNTTNVVENVQAATSDFGEGLNVEYIWLKSLVNTPNVVGNPHWSVVAGSENQLSLTLADLTSTTYFIRCARVEGCEMYWGETNIVGVPVDLCKAEFINAGSIAFEGSYNPNQTNVVANVQAATSDFGEGLNIEYIWLKSLVNTPNVVGNPHWSVVAGSQNQLSLTLADLTETTYFIRCARVEGCEMYWGETNIVGVPVDICKAEFINAGSIAFEGSYNPNQTNVVANVQAATSDFGEGLNIEYIWLKSLVNTPNVVGNPHWSVVEGSQNQLSLTLADLTETTYFIRCARVEGCEMYWGETNIVGVPVDICKAEFINAGSIAFEGSYNPNTTNVVENVEAGSSDFGEGLNIEYIWLKSLVNTPNVVGNPNWSVVEGSENQLSLTLADLTETTYFIRCARVEGCEMYWGETNIVGVPVDLCKAEFINAGSIAFEGSYNPNTTNVVENVEAGSSDFGEGLNIEYIWLKSLVNTPNVVGNPHWSVVEGSENQLSLTLADLTATTYFIRCARVEGCEMYWGETNIVGVPVDLCKAEFINAGSIAFEGSYNPNTTNVVENVEAGSSDFGEGLNVEYIWLKSLVNTPNVVGNPNWSVVEGSENQLSLTLADLTATTYFIRCARVEGCEMYWGETNIVEVIVDPCLEGYIGGGSIGFDDSYDPLGPNTITNVALPNGPYQGLGFEYIWLQSEVNVPNTVGNNFWTLVSGSLNLLELEVSNLTQTMYFIRCARYIGCQNYWGESNIVGIEGFEIPTATISGGGEVCGPQGTANISVELTGVGPFNITYSDGTTNTSVTFDGTNYSFEGTAGTYSLVSVTDANYQATLQGQAVVAAYDIPTAVLSGGGMICSDDQSTELTVNMTGAAPWVVTYSENGEIFEFETSEASHTLSVGSGAYQLISVQDALCSGIATGNAQVSLFEKPTAVIAGGGSICDASEEVELTIALTGTAPWSITYSVDGQNMLAVANTNVFTMMAGPGVYQLMAVDDNLCSGTVSGSAEVSVIPSFDGGIVLDEQYCVGEEILVTINNAEGSPISWSTNGGGQLTTVNNTTVSYQPLPSETSVEFVAQVTTDCGIVELSAQTTIVPEVDTQFATAANVDKYLTNVNYTFIPEFDEGDSYVWYINEESVNSQTLNNEFETAGEYTISLTIEKDGCVSSESMGITVNSNQNLFIPNVFNPNSSNPDNNVVKVYAEGVQDRAFLFRIYNRWGKLVYETTDFNQARNSGWNGYFNGELQANGNYTYTVRGYFSDGQSFERTGVVSISK